MPSRIEPQDIGTRCWMIISVPLPPAWLTGGGMATSHLLSPSVGDGGGFAVYQSSMACFRCANCQGLAVCEGFPWGKRRL